MTRRAPFAPLAVSLLLAWLALSTMSAWGWFV